MGEFYARFLDGDCDWGWLLVADWRDLAVFRVYENLDFVAYDYEEYTPGC